MKLIKMYLPKWIEAILILVVGILVIVAGAQMGNTSMDALVNGNGSAETIKSISLVLGWSFIVVGSAGVAGALASAIFTESGFSGITAGVTLAIGIWLVVRQEAGKLMFVLIGFVPYVMIVVGAVLAVSAMFLAINGIRGKFLKNALPTVIVEVLLGIASIVLGSLCIATAENGNTVIASNIQLIIFGSILVVYAIIKILSTFIYLPFITTVTTVKKGDSNNSNMA